MIGMDVLYKFVKSGNEEKDSGLWDEIVEIYKDKTIDYNTFLVFPFCEDGYKQEIKEGLEKKGWATGRAGITYKEKIPYSEIVDCIIFNRSYRKTCYFLTEGDWKRNVLLKVNQFLELVDTKFRIEKKYNLEIPKKMVWENLLQFLEKLKFSIFRPVS